MTRTTAFKKTTVEEFFDNLVQVMDRHQFPADRIYNMNKTGCTTVQKARKTLARLGQKQVGALR